MPRRVNVAITRELSRSPINPTRPAALNPSADESRELAMQEPLASPSGEEARNQDSN